MQDGKLENIDKLVAEFCRRMQLNGCDAVQVLASIHDEASEETLNKAYGRGNWYARQGLARDFLTAEEARTSEYTKRNEFDES